MQQGASTREIQYSKYPKIWNSLIHTFLVCFFLFVQLFLKIVSGMANSAEPDETALFAYAILSDSLLYEILGHLPYHMKSSQLLCVGFLHI